MNKIKIAKLPRTLEIDSVIEPDSDYVLTIRIARDGKILLDSHGDDTQNEIYLTNFIAIEQLQKVGTNSTINVKLSKGQSVVGRIILKEIAELLGKDPDIYYQDYMSRWIDSLKKKRDELKA